MWALKAGYQQLLSEEVEDEQRASPPAEKWNFVWINRQTFQQERERIESAVTAGRINDKKQPERINGGLRKAASAFVLAVRR